MILDGIVFKLPQGVDFFDGAKMPKLRSFEIVNCLGLRGPWLLSLSSCQRVETFLFSGVALPNAFLEQANFPRLTSLSLEEGVSGNPRKIGEFLSRHLGQLETLSLGEIPEPLIEVLSAMEAPRNVTDLTLGYCGDAECSQISQEQLNSFLPLFPKCESLHLNWTENIKTLPLSEGPLISSITSLELDGMYSLETEQIQELLDRSHTLASLGMEYGVFDPLPRLYLQSPTIEHLSLSNKLFTAAVIKECPKLTEINIWNEDESGYLRYIEVRGPCPALSTLRLSHITLKKGFWRNTLPSIIKNGPTFLTIHINKIHRSLLYLLRKNKLAYFFLWNCQQISDQLLKTLQIHLRALPSLFQDGGPEVSKLAEAIPPSTKIFKVKTKNQIGFIETNVPESVQLLGEAQGKSPDSNLQVAISLARLHLFSKVIMFGGFSSDSSTCPFPPLP